MAKEFLKATLVELESQLDETSKQKDRYTIREYKLLKDIAEVKKAISG